MKGGVLAVRSHMGQVVGWTATLALVVVAISCTSPGGDPSVTTFTTVLTTPEPTDPPATSVSPATTSIPTPEATAPSTTMQPLQFYVSPSGDDDNPGSEDLPWGTLQHALVQLEPGHTLTVRDGTFRERIRIDVTPGTSDQPIVVQAAPGEEPIVQGLLWLREPDHWVVDGINVTWDEEENDDEEHMVKFTDGVGWELRNSELWGARSFAALLIAASEDVEGEPNGWTVTGNCIHDTFEANETNQDQLVYVNTGTEPTNGRIENNILFGAENGSGIKLGGSSADSGGAHAVTVRNNTIMDAAQGILIGWGSSGNVLTGNLFAGTDEGYGHIRGFELDGENNVAADNGGDDHEPFILNDDGYTGVQDEGGNVTGLEVLDGEPSCTFQPEGETAAFGVQTDLAEMATR